MKLLSLPKINGLLLVVLIVTFGCPAGAQNNCGLTNRTVQCGTEWSFDTPTIIDPCNGSNVFPAVLDTFGSSSCAPIFTRTWSFTNSCGASDSCSQTVTFVNTNPPVFECPNDKTVPCSPSWDFDAPVAYDACGNTNIAIGVFNTITTGSGCSQTITRVWQATDCWGNQATCSQTVTTTDATPPVITSQPTNQSLTIGGAASFHVSATGSSPLTFTWLLNGAPMDAPSSNSLSVASVQMANAGSYWVVAQNAGGAATSQVAHLYVALPPPASGLSLSVSNNHGTMMLAVTDDGRLPYPWQLQSTRSLSPTNWTFVMNGAGNALVPVTPQSGSKFFRAARVLPATTANDLQDAFQRLPAAEFNTGLLGGTLGAWYPSIESCDGSLLDIDAAIDPNRLLSPSDFLQAYNALRADVLPGGPVLPDLSEIKVTIDPGLAPIRLEQDLAFEQIYALAAAIIPYNAIATNAFDSARLQIVSSNNVPIDLSNSNPPPNVPPFYFVQGSNSGPYLLTNVFAGAAAFRTVLQSPTQLVRFMLPKEYLITPTAVDSVQIRFPGFPLVSNNGLTNEADSGFLDIAPDQVFVWDFSTVTLDTNGTAQIPFVLRITMGETAYDAAGSISLLPPRLPLPPHDCSTTITYYFPAARPLWWPSDVWNARASAALFYQGARPSWWPGYVPWPTPYRSYKVGGSVHDHNPHSTNPDKPRYDSFGILTGGGDTQVLGPTWNSDTGAVGQVPAGGVNLRGGYRARLYPATYRNFDPNRCKALNLVLIVDGIDTRSTGAARTEEDMWKDFGPEGQRLLDKGYDVLVLNYLDGDDYIQRNAYALLNVLTNYVPGIMASGHENDRVAVIAASMGTQVTRYALVIAEQVLNTDHHVGLAMYLDGPFLGANLPWSSQGLLQFLGYNSVQASDAAKHSLNDVLLSPAAKQLLQASIRYAPDPLHAAFFDEMRGYTNAGLPYHARNVAVSCGSGIGMSMQNIVGAYPRTEFSAIEKPYASMGLLTWGGAVVDALAEGPLQSHPSQIVLNAALQGGIKEAIIVKNDSVTFSIVQGARPSDMTPGGATGLGQTMVNEYNKAAGNLSGMVGFHNNCFIPLYSTLYVRSAESNCAQEQIQANVTHHSSPAEFIGYPGLSLPIYRKHTDFWYAPEVSGTIDPATTSKTAFDAIWYQATTNYSHVLDWDAAGNGLRLPLGYEAFLFNDLDAFTSGEQFSSESVASTQPTMPMHESFLIGDLVDDNTEELLTINTFTRHAMVQSFRYGNWQELWADTPGGNWYSTPGTVGQWTLQKGDKFYLARLAGGKRLLLSFSATTPSSAMVQELVNSGGFYSWNKLWENSTKGTFDDAHLVAIRPTNLYATGDVDGNNTTDRLLVVYPFVCSDYREALVPGTSGLSKASLMEFVQDSPNHYSWSEVWNNSANIDTIGSAFLRFGDRLQFGKLDFGASSLFSVNVLRTTFGGEAWLQKYAVGSSSWEPVWSDHGQYSQQCSGCNRNIGCWAFGNLRDKFYFADLDGDGLDELICANEQYWAAFHFADASSGWCPLPYSADPSNNSMLGTYQLRIGDRFFFGNLDGNGPGAEVLVVNPVEPCPSCSIHLVSARQAVIQRWTSGGWQHIWDSGNSRSIGFWDLYQDVP